MPSSGRVSEEELALFSERIAATLADRPLDLSAPAHRERVARLLREVGDASLYELLGIDPAAAVLAVHEGYERTARLVHTQHAQRLGLVGREGVLELLFERVTEAYLTLSETEKRKEYDRQRPSWRLPAVPAVSRAEEAQRLYERARALVAAEQFHAAIELLREAVRTTPKADYLAMLGLLQTKNPLWLRSAEEHLRRAVEMGARDPNLPSALAEVRRRIETGDPGSDSREIEIL
jgi:curved DNA-binding protein CbpA